MALRSLAAINAAPFRTPSLVISNRARRRARPFTHQRAERRSLLRDPDFVLALIPNNLIDLMFIRHNLVFNIDAS